MARLNRRELLADGEIQVVHCVNRCVRRGFLCGVDELTGKNYEHRRQWMRNRLEFLAGVFGVEVIGFSVMSNHLHVILRSRPDVVKTWSEDEVARRWWNLFPQRRNQDGSPADPSEADLNHLTGSASTLAELRSRLSSISWFMRCTSEVIARMANAEDECTGRFWEGRFKATVLPDEAAIAACMAYVDLNPVRAGIAKSPDQSDFTSAQERIADLKSAEEVSTADAKDVRIEHGSKAGWMAPVELALPLTAEAISSTSAAYSAMNDAFDEVLKRESVDLRLLILMTAASLNTPENDLRQPLTDRLLQELIRNPTHDQVSEQQNVRQSDPTAVIRQSDPTAVNRHRTATDIRRDLTCAVLAHMLPAEASLIPLKSELIRRAVSAAREAGDETQLSATLQTCRDTAVSAGMTELSSELQRECDQLCGIRKARKFPEQVNFTSQLQTWLAL